ncbi:MAG: family 16 glycoside hydrolase, partial [Ignavibacteria bacterium]
MKRLHLITKLFLILIIPVNGQEFKKGEWAGLFNGYDFENWTIKFTGHELNDNYKNTFRAEDGILKVSYDEYERFSGEFGHIFYKDKFSNYRIRLEYRFTGEQIE